MQEFMSQLTWAEITALAAVFALLILAITSPLDAGDAEYDDATDF